MAATSLKYVFKCLGAKLSKSRKTFLCRPQAIATKLLQMAAAQAQSMSTRTLLDEELPLEN